MAKMRILTPQIQKLRERVGDDRQKLNQEMMKRWPENLMTNQSESNEKKVKK